MRSGRSDGDLHRHAGGPDRDGVDGEPVDDPTRLLGRAGERAAERADLELDPLGPHRRERGVDMATGAALGEGLDGELDGDRHDPNGSGGRAGR